MWIWHQVPVLEQLRTLNTSLFRIFNVFLKCFWVPFWTFGIIEVFPKFSTPHIMLITSYGFSRLCLAQFLLILGEQYRLVKLKLIGSTALNGKVCHQNCLNLLKDLQTYVNRFFVSKIESNKNSRITITGILFKTKYPFHYKKKELCFRQMGTFRSVTVLISNIVQRVLLSVGSDPRDRSTNGNSSMIGTAIFQFSLLLSVNSIARFVTAV